MSRSARALRGVIATASLTVLLGLLLIAMPLISVYRTQLEWWTDVGAGALLVVLGSFDLVAVARGNVETMVWRSIAPALAGLALALSPVLGSSSTLYEGATIAAGVAAVALSAAGGWLSASVPLPMPTFQRQHA